LAFVLDSPVWRVRNNPGKCSEDGCGEKLVRIVTVERFNAPSFGTSRRVAMEADEVGTSFFSGRIVSPTDRSRVPVIIPGKVCLDTVKSENPFPG
jgi:hypothetical protein